jgi:hypothetical protein
MPLNRASVSIACMKAKRPLRKMPKESARASKEQVRAMLVALRKYRGQIPADFKFDREEADQDVRATSSPGLSPWRAGHSHINLPLSRHTGGRFGRATATSALVAR